MVTPTRTGFLTSQETAERAMQKRVAVRPTLFRLTTIAVLLLFAAPLAAEAQPIPKVGLLGDASWEPLRQGLRELGYVEGKTLILELRQSEGRATRLPELAHELVRVNVHVIVSQGTPATFAAMRATATIPIVLAAT